MLRSLKRRRVASRVTQSAAKAQTVVKQVRHLPRGRAAEQSATSDRLAHFKSVRLVDRDVPTDLQVERGVAERLDARAVEKHVPVIEFLRCGDECERGVAQLCG